MISTRLSPDRPRRPGLFRYGFDDGSWKASDTPAKAGVQRKMPRPTMDTSPRRGYSKNASEGWHPERSWPIDRGPQPALGFRRTDRGSLDRPITGTTRAPVALDSGLRRNDGVPSIQRTSFRAPPGIQKKRWIGETHLHPSLWIPAYAGMTEFQASSGRHCGLRPESRRNLGRGNSLASVIVDPSLRWGHSRNASEGWHPERS